MLGLAPKYLSWLWQGFLLTLGLAAASAIAATAGGLVLAILRHARHRAWRAAAAAYVVTFRNTPLLVQLLFWYFGVASLLPDTWVAWLNARHAWHAGPVTLAWPSFEFVAGWVGLSAYTAAFVAEECEAGLRGVPGAQRDAAVALGLTPLQALRYVILPQAVRIALPPLFGQYMNLVKNSSLAMAIGVAELSYASRQVETETFKTFAAFGVATVLYIAAAAVIEAVAYAAARWRDRLGVAG
ncbi:amino acid ABC transporter permease [Burkholderia stagnalis]|uniref:Amino acid ABC transporter permease n=1 Tax=Burkholderia stagnalis TaxID=1503054 RepID=A0A108GUI0_9BURK|nr:amino acid ABC transporter permease [Burkholderia stagnalis]KVL84334.1 amino acid ABC transporter permease [Burkholderia stagnalis]KVL98554.1 amino acid ABC transporter permease [Burkholderia stagnalis]KVM16845.1 amino acid ABC transporter permease [Burkholderia stagnalis]KVZ18697.1 amino acid ABC transporter permease [Burkholderia stagnalis]KWA46045.1 amino acid ABC transporter permease [Burkholderia stagnalis]